MAECVTDQLDRFRQPIHDSLLEYQHASGEGLTFNLDEAMVLEPAPAEKAYSARSAAIPVHFKNLLIGNLVVVAFAPGDCTGDETKYDLDQLSTGEYPCIPGVVPRSKAALHTEAHLTLASLQTDSRDAEPILFAGHLDLLGVRGGVIRKLADLGQSRHAYERTMVSRSAQRTVTATTGYSGPNRIRIESARKPNTTRFGDPHAVYNPTSNIQICAFLGIRPRSGGHGLPALRSIGVRVPRLEEV